GFFDDDVVNRDVLMTSLHRGGNILDLFNHIHAVYNLTENSVAPTLNGLRGVVEEVVVLDVDKELSGGGVRLHGACHGQSAGLVGKSVIGFVLDRGANGFLLHATLKAATLNHEVADHAMENSAVVVTAADIFLEVGCGLGSLVFEQLDGDDAMIGMEQDHCRLPCIEKEGCR